MAKNLFLWSGRSWIRKGLEAWYTMLMELMPVISDKLPWTIAVYAPEDDFTGVIKENRTTNIWLAALVAALSRSASRAYRKSGAAR